MHSSGRIAAMHFRQTLVPSRCSEDRLRGTQGERTEKPIEE